jgi:hypothetical protein
VSYSRNVAKFKPFLDKKELRELTVKTGRSHLPFFLDALPNKITTLISKHVSPAIQRLKKPINQLKVEKIKPNFSGLTVL